MPRNLNGWGFIFDMQTGALVSRATVVATTLPPGLGLVERTDDLDLDTERWDAATRRVVPFTNTDKAAVLRAHAEALSADADRIDGGAGKAL